jgi:hypothetical protein
VDSGTSTSGGAYAGVGSTNGGAACAVSGTVDGGIVAIGGWAVTVTVGGSIVLVTVDVTVELRELSDGSEQFPISSKTRMHSATLPPMISPRLLVGGFGGWPPEALPSQYAVPAEPTGSGYQPGSGAGAVRRHRCDSTRRS